MSPGNKLKYAKKNVSNSCLWYWINFVEYKEKYLRLTLRSHVALPFAVPGDNILDKYFEVQGIYRSCF